MTYQAFFIFDNEDICFAEQELVWKIYSAAEALSTIRRMKIINKKEFAIAEFNEDDENLIMHITALSVVDSNVHLSWHVQIALLKVEKVIILSKYIDYTNVFSSDFVVELPKHIGINNHLIDLIDDKLSPYYLIYSLGPVEVKMLKIYLKTNLANNFTRLYKSPVGAPILFICKKDGSF